MGMGMGMDRGRGELFHATSRFMAVLHKEGFLHEASLPAVGYMTFLMSHMSMSTSTVKMPRQ
jgi:hypothetical protein